MSEPPPPVQVEALPPERGQRSIVLGSGCCSCCCCCSCCLHAATGVVGSMVASSQALGAATSTDKTQSIRVAVTTYWAMVFGLSWLTTLLASNTGAGLMGALVVLGFGLPVLQLMASVLTSVVIHTANLPDRPAAVAALGRMTLYGVLGGIAGVGAMIGLGVPLAFAL